MLVFCYYSLRVEDGGKGKKNYGTTKDFLIFFYMIIDDFVVAWYSMGCAIQEVNLIQSNPQLRSYSYLRKQKKSYRTICNSHLCSGGGTRTHDLRIMNPTL